MFPRKNQEVYFPICYSVNSLFFLSHKINVEKLCNWIDILDCDFNIEIIIPFNR